MKKIAVLGVLLVAIILAGCAHNSMQRQIYYASGITTVTDKETGTIALTMDPTSVANSFAVALMSGDTMHLEVMPATPDSGAALRLGQIKSPDGQYDGPFASVVDYTATQSGSYQFFFGQDLMAAEDHYTGNATVYIIISH